jgi:hypothetical protein
VIFFLLTAYIEALRFGDYLPARFTSLPVAGIDDVGRRYHGLMVELDSARKLHDKAFVRIKEALHVFGTALHRPALLHAAAGKATSGVDDSTASPSSSRGHSVGLYPGFPYDPRPTPK